MTNPSNLSPLIEKIEAAEEGSFELTRAVHKAAKGDDPWFVYAGYHYTTSIDAIVGLIERELPGSWWQISSDGIVWIVTEGGEQGQYRARTPALALCAAFLRAIQAKREAPPTPPKGET